MAPEDMLMLTDKTADALIEALKLAPLVNITWGERGGMFCGNPLRWCDPGRFVRQRRPSGGHQSCQRGYQQG